MSGEKTLYELQVNPYSRSAIMVAYADPMTNDIHVILGLPKTGMMLYLILSDQECDDSFGEEIFTELGKEIHTIVLKTNKEEMFSKIVLDQLDEYFTPVMQRDRDGFLVLERKRYEPKNPDLRIFICNRPALQPNVETQEYLRAFLAQIQLDRDIAIKMIPLIKFVARFGTKAAVLYNSLTRTCPNTVKLNHEILQTFSKQFAKTFMVSRRRDTAVRLLSHYSWNEF